MDLKKLEKEGPQLSINHNKEADELPDGAPIEKHVALSWLLCVCGWLICAFLCLWLIIELEAWPNAYDMFFWAIILILFCNIFLFLFISTRWGKTAKAIAFAVLKICIGEGLILFIFYLLGKFAIGS